MAKQLEHPVLGLMVADHWAWRLQREVIIPCAGYAPRSVGIIEESSLGPSPEQLQALVDLLKLPPSLRDTIADAIFRAYVEEIRPLYFEIISDTPDEYEVTLEQLAEVKEPCDIWRLITGIHSVWVKEDATINVNYTTAFDAEHELRIQFRGNRIERVLMA